MQWSRYSTADLARLRSDIHDRYHCDESHATVICICEKHLCTGRGGGGCGVRCVALRSAAEKKNEVGTPRGVRCGSGASPLSMGSGVRNPQWIAPDLARDPRGGIQPPTPRSTSTWPPRRRVPSSRQRPCGTSRWTGGPAMSTASHTWPS